MSSSFGGISGGSGNRVVYVVTVDSSGVAQGLQTAEQAFNRFNTSTQSTARNLQTINSPLQQLDTAFQGVGTNVDSASQSFNGMDNSLQTTSQSIKNTTTDLDAINGNWQQMDSGASNASNSIDAVGSSFNNAKGGLTEYNTLSGEVVTNTQNMGDATQTMGDKMKNAGSFLKNNALSVSLVASGIVGLVSSYTQLQKAQLASERASLMKEKTDQRVVKAQDALNKAVAKYGPNSHEARVKAEDLRLAMEAQGVATQKAGLAAQTAAQATASFIPQLLQDAVLIGGGIANMTTGLKDGIPVIKGFASALKTGLAPALLAASGPVLVAVVGIYALIGALRAAQKLNELVQQKTGGQAQTMSGFEAMRKTLFGTPEEKKQAADFDKQLKNNIITTKEYTDVMKDAFNPISIVDDIVGQVNTSLGKLNATQAQTTEETDTLTDSTTSLTEAIVSQVTSVDDQLKVYQDQVKAQKDIVAATKPFTEEMLKQFTVVDENSKSFDGLRATGSAYNDVMKVTSSTTADVSAAINKEIKSVKDLGMGETVAKNNADALAKGNEHMLESLDKSKARVDALRKSFQEFAANSRMDLADAFGLKDVGTRVDKLVKKITDDLPNKIGKLKIKSKLNMEIDQASIGKAAGKVVAGLSNEISSSDKVADAVAKSIKQNLPKGDAGDAMKKFLDKAIKESNTAQILKDNLKQLEDGSWVLNIPTKSTITEIGFDAKAGFSTTGGSGSSGINLGGKSVSSFKGSTSGMLTSKPVGTVPLIGKITKIDFGFTPGVPQGDINLGDLLTNGKIFGGNNTNSTGGTGGANPEWLKKFQNLRTSLGGRGTGLSGVNDPTVAAQQLQKSLANLANQGANSMRILGAAVKTNINSISNYAKGATVSAQKLQTGLANLSNEGIKSEVALGKASKTQFNSVANYAKGATVSAQKLQTGLANLSNEGIKSMKSLASSAKTNFNTVANYAKGATSAVKSLQSAIDNLQDKTVHVNVIRSGSTSLARGGIISAAGGYTTNGPELLIVGDNPGGRETIAAIPNNAPSNIMNQLNRKFGSGGSGSVVNQTVVLHISGNDIINERNLTKRIKLTVGENRDRFG